MKHAGKLLVEQLEVEGTERVFSVPGESFLAVLDGLHDSPIRNVVCRHEGAAAMMAEATGKLGGRPGVAFVTRGPGATNAAAGIHVARQDSTPMVLFVGQVARGHRDREAFQEVDYRRMFAPLVKWVAEIDDAARVPEYVNRAFHVAMSGRPGPVVLALPEDMLTEAPGDIPLRPRAEPTRNAAGIDEAELLYEHLMRASKPLCIVGGSGWSETARRDLEAFAETFDLPVAVSFRRQDYIDNRRATYVGDLGVGMSPALARRVAEADCLLVIGARLGDIATAGYSLVDPARPKQRILHVHPDPDEPGKVFPAELAIAASSHSMLGRLVTYTRPNAVRWSDWRAAARADYEAWQRRQETPGPVKLEEIVWQMSETLPEDTIVTNGAGNFAAFLHRYYRWKRFGTQLAPTSGSMGYGFPAAIAAKLAHADRTVVCLAGDGDFQMTLNEFSTAMQHDAAVIVIVVNNGRYGTIRMHQERAFPGRVSGTELANPDFAALARAYGGHGETVLATEDFVPAFRRAAESGRPAVIELRLDPRVLSTTRALEVPAG